MQLNHRFPRHAGFSLIEVLVALVVLSIGFSGYAALQIIGIRSVEDSYQRSQMTLLVEEMAERMRANRGAFNEGLLRASGAPWSGRPVPTPDDWSAYHGLNFVQGTSVCTGSGGLGATVINALRCEQDAPWPSQACNAAQLANYDAARVFCGYADPNGRWLDGVTNISEKASLSIACNLVPDPAGGPNICPTGAQHTITASWTSAESDRDDAVDQDGDGDKFLMTQRVIIVVTP